MPRKKAAQNCIIVPWLSARQDCKEGRFLQLGNSMLFSPVIQSLSGNTLFFYLALSMEAGGRPYVVFSHGVAWKKYHIAPTTYDRAKKSLSKRG